MPTATDCKPQDAVFDLNKVQISTDKSPSNAGTRISTIIPAHCQLADLLVQLKEKGTNNYFSIFIFTGMFNLEDQL